MGDDQFSGGRRGPGRSQSERVQEWPDWVRREQAESALAKEIDEMFVPVALRALVTEETREMALPLAVSLDNSAAAQFLEKELSWGELGADFIRRFLPEGLARAEFTVATLYDRILEERRYEDSPLISSYDLNAALERATSIGLLEIGYQGDRVGADRVYRLSQHYREISDLIRLHEQ